MLIDQIKADLTGAMKSRDVGRLSVLRMLVSAINYRQIELQHDLSDEEILVVVAKEVKKRNEAIESYKAGGREEQAKTEADEAEVLKKYLPEMMGEEDLRSEIEKEMKNINVEDTGDFGKVMRVISPLFRGKADGSVVAKIVKEFLARSS